MLRTRPSRSPKNSPVLSRRSQAVAASSSIDDAGSSSSDKCDSPIIPVNSPILGSGGDSPVSTPLPLPPLKERVQQLALLAFARELNGSGTTDAVADAYLHAVCGLVPGAMRQAFFALGASTTAAGRSDRVARPRSRTSARRPTSCCGRPSRRAALCSCRCRTTAASCKTTRR